MTDVKLNLTHQLITYLLLKTAAFGAVELLISKAWRRSILERTDDTTTT